MVKNHNLAKAISDCGWSEFTTMLKYKAEKEGKIYVEVDRFFPSSKTCHVCLSQIGRLPIEVRSWNCFHCQTKHDRDVNAAINIRDEGLRLLALGTSDPASGGNVRPAARCCPPVPGGQVTQPRGRKTSVSAILVETGSPIRHLLRGSSRSGMARSKDKRRCPEFYARTA